MQQWAPPSNGEGWDEQRNAQWRADPASQSVSSSPLPPLPLRALSQPLENLELNRLDCAPSLPPRSQSRNVCTGWLLRANTLQWTLSTSRSAHRSGERTRSPHRLSHPRRPRRPVPAHRLRRLQAAVIPTHTTPTLPPPRSPSSSSTLFRRPTPPSPPNPSASASCQSSSRSSARCLRSPTRRRSILGRRLDRRWA